MDEDGLHSYLPDLHDIRPVYRDQWIKVINEIPLPPASFGDVAVLTTSQMSFKELVDLISADPVLCGKILAVVNSAIRGLTNPLTDIRKAVVHIGRNITRIVVLAYYVEGLLARWEHYPKQHFTFVRKWAACAAVLAYHFAKAANLPDAGTLATAALLSRLGTLVLGLEWPGPSHEYRLQPDEQTRLGYELATWQINTPILSGILTRQWGLPEPLPTYTERHMAALYEELAPGPEGTRLTLLAASTIIAADFLRHPDGWDELLSIQPDSVLLLGNLQRSGLTNDILATVVNPRVLSELAMLTK